MLTGCSSDRSLGPFVRTGPSSDMVAFRELVSLPVTPRAVTFATYYGSEPRWYLTEQDWYLIAVLQYGNETLRLLEAGAKEQGHDFLLDLGELPAWVPAEVKEKVVSEPEKAFRLNGRVFDAARLVRGGLHGGSFVVVEGTDYLILRADRWGPSKH